MTELPATLPDSVQIPPDVRDDMHELYRQLHQTPELSMQEHRTAALIIERMEGLGYETVRCGGTGVVATIRNGVGPVIGWRADIDGLPIAEKTGLAYASAARGTLPDGSDVPVMHACGHDTHVTAAIGAATLLARARARWSGTVVFIFQPAEETAEGAAAMVADGLWERAPRPDVIYGQHVWSGRAGQIEISSGPAMAMADSWKVTVRGRGGHGSRPEDTIDPVVIAAHMVVRIQTVVAREVAPQQAAVVTIATFHAGVKENIIPSAAEFTVNVRTLDAGVRERVLLALRRVIAAEAQASGAAEPEVEELYRFPLLLNDPAETERVTAALSAALGEHNVIERPARMGSEDFGHLPDAIGAPGVYWFFGGMPDEVVDGTDPVPSNHSPLFAPVIEPTLSTGISAAFVAITSRLATNAPADV